MPRSIPEITGIIDQFSEIRPNSHTGATETDATLDTWIHGATYTLSENRTIFEAGKTERCGNHMRDRYLDKRGTDREMRHTYPPGGMCLTGDHRTISENMTASIHLRSWTTEILSEIRPKVIIEHHKGNTKK
jgi:hypothetical protein